MALRLIGTDDANPRLPVAVINATQGTAHADLAPGDVGVIALFEANAYTDQAIADVVAGGIDFADNIETITGTSTVKALSPAGLAFERPYVDVRSLGAMGDGTTDDTAAIQAAIDAAAANQGTVLFPAGIYKTSATLVIGSCDVEATAAAIIQSSASPAVQLGSVSPAVTLASKTLRMPRLAPVVADTGVGMKLVRAYHNNIWLPSVSGFDDGIVAQGDGAGVTYNTFVVGTVASYTRNLVVDSVNSGWSTQNTFIGGRWLFTRAGSTIAGVRQVQFGVSTSSAVDGSTFVGCSFEGDQPQYHVEAYGNLCSYLNCRFENGTSPRFSFQGTARGNRFINPYSSSGYAVVTTAAGASGNVFEGMINADYDERSATKMVRHHTNSATPVELLFATDQDIYAATLASTNWRLKRTADSTQYKATADTVARLQILHTTGDLLLSGGSTTNDLQVKRAGAGYLNVSGNAAESINDFFNTSNAEGHRLRLSVDAANSLAKITSTQSSGSTFPLHFFLAGAVKLRITATATEVVDALKVGGNVGFYNTTPIAKPAVTGAKGGNAALTSLCTQLAALGLITDSTT